MSQSTSTVIDTLYATKTSGYGGVCEFTIRDEDGRIQHWPDFSGFRDLVKKMAADGYAYAGKDPTEDDAFIFQKVTFTLEGGDSGDGDSYQPKRTW